MGAVPPDDVNAILLLSLMSPIAELFPNLYMSWWEPSNAKLMAYVQASRRRYVVVLVVWVPILVMIDQLVSTVATLALVVLVFGAFGLRTVLFDRAIQELTGSEGPLSERPRASTLPEALYFIALTAIGVVIYVSVPDSQWLVAVGILGIFGGASGMARFRLGPADTYASDIAARVVFALAFVLNLYNLARAVTATG